MTQDQDRQGRGEGEPWSSRAWELCRLCMEQGHWEVLRVNEPHACRQCVQADYAGFESEIKQRDERIAQLEAVMKAIDDNIQYQGVEEWKYRELDVPESRVDGKEFWAIYDAALRAGKEGR